MHQRAQKIRPNRRLAGYTLLELVVASASAAVLVGGLASSLFIAAQSLDAGSDTLATRRTASLTLEKISRDLQSAKTLSELTATSVTMTVPDRNGDSVAETIRYYWSGSTGDPLLEDYNGTTTTLANDVQSFSLAWATRLIEGVSVRPIILFVSGQYSDGDGGLGTPTAAEQDRIDLMETWGYDVTVISQEATQAEFDAQLATSNVIFVPGTVNSGTLGSKINDTSLGIVTESHTYAATLGFYSSFFSFSIDQSTINITNTTHYITEGFAAGDLTVTNSNQPIKWTNSPLAPDGATLAMLSTTLLFPTMVILDAGDELANAASAPGRRCQLPWGEGGFDVRELNADGLTIMQRALEWAAGAGDDTETVTTGIVFEEFTERQEGSGTTSITIDTPTGYASGDLLIAAVVTDSDRASSLSPPAGWTEVVVASESDGRTTLGVWWKIAGSEPSNHTFTWSGSEEAYGWIMRFTGHEPSNPIHATATDEGENDSPTAPSVTTSVDDCLILRIGGYDDDDIFDGDPGMSGHTTITANKSGTGTSSCSGAAAYEMLDTAGSSGTANFSLDRSEEWRTLTIAIEPDPSP